MPKVTVIIAAYNRSRLLKCALTSLCNQTHKDFEAWIVGDCCTDDSGQIVAGFCDARLNWSNLPERVGSQSGPNNEGLKRARGEYIAYLGQDDLWFPWHLQSLVTTIEQTNTDFVHAVVALLAPDRPPEAAGAPECRRSDGERNFSPSGCLHKRKIAETCGPWPLPEGLTGCVDFVFQRRAFFAGYRFAGTGRVSVIKFPSAYWRTYARSEGFPQEQYLSRMQQSCNELEIHLLTQMVVASVQRAEDLSIMRSLRMFLRSVYWRAVDWYGRDNWPLSIYFREKQHRGRQSALPRRGLSPIPSEAAEAKNQPGSI